MIGTKRIEREKKTISQEQIFFTGTKFFTADQFNVEVDKPQPNNKPQRRVFAFLEQVEKETRVSRGKARLDLARKMNERSRLVETRKNRDKDSEN